MSHLNLAMLRSLTGAHIGRIDVACPLCGPECRTAVNRRRKVLRVWDDGAFVTYKCARCEAHGWAKDERGEFTPSREREKPRAPEPDRSDLAQFLWSKSLPLRGSLAENYLRARQCFVESPSLRFLPGRGEHPPAMIARFGTGAVTGVHLTKLKADGAGKAGSDKDKIMIGKSVGQPIIVCDNMERGELLIAEGIEDAASLALCSGWSAWAVGAAGRIPEALTSAGRFERVYIADDNDPPLRIMEGGRCVGYRPGASKRALERARMIRPDLVPVRVARALGVRESLDANKALIKYGADVLLAVIEWCDAQAALACGEIGFHAMQTAMARADGVFRAIASADL